MTDEELAHYGVLGMKWGRTRTKATAGDIRKARNRLSVKQTKYVVQNDRVKAAKKSGNATKLAKEKQTLNKMKASFLKDPDRVTASRMTRGEKAAVFLLSVPTTGGIVGVGAIAGSSAVSRRIEQKQDTGAYDKK